MRGENTDVRMGPCFRVGGGAGVSVFFPHSGRGKPGNFLVLLRGGADLEGHLKCHLKHVVVVVLLVDLLAACRHGDIEPERLKGGKRWLAEWSSVIKDVAPKTGSFFVRTKPVAPDCGG